MVLMLQVRAASSTSAAACTFTIPSPPSYVKLRNLIYVAYVNVFCFLRSRILIGSKGEVEKVDTAGCGHEHGHGHKWELTDLRCTHLILRAL